jgi:hypothetical protein
VGGHPPCRRLAVHRDRPRVRAAARPPRRRTPQPGRARDRRTRPDRHLLAWIDSEQLRRETGIGLNRHEGRHSVARVIFHGNQGQLRQPYRDGQEDQLGALGFALNALVVWNAQYLDDAIAELRATDHQITDEDLERLSPLQHEHITMLGNFPFTLPHELGDGQRRRLRELGEAAERTFLFRYDREAQTQAKVLAALRAAPGSNTATVAEAAGVPAKTASATISRLVKQGRMRRLDDGGLRARRDAHRPGPDADRSRARRDRPSHQRSAPWPVAAPARDSASPVVGRPRPTAAGSPGARAVSFASPRLDVIRPFSEVKPSGEARPARDVESAPAGAMSVGLRLRAELALGREDLVVGVVAHEAVEHSLSSRGDAVRCLGC